MIKMLSIKLEAGITISIDIEVPCLTLQVCESSKNLQHNLPEAIESVDRSLQFYEEMKFSFPDLSYLLDSCSSLFPPTILDRACDRILGESKRLGIKKFAICYINSAELHGQPFIEVPSNPGISVRIYPNSKSAKEWLKRKLK